MKNFPPTSAGTLPNFRVSFLRGVGRQYAFRFPRPIPAEFLQEIARRFSGIDIFLQRPLHLIAIANSGVPIASVAMCERYHRNPSCPTWLTVADPRRPLEPVPPAGDPRALPVLLDNSVHSGRTVRMVLKGLGYSGLAVRYLVKLIDYQDEYEASLIDDLLKAYGIHTISLFTRDELLPSLDLLTQQEVKALG